MKRRSDEKKSRVSWSTTEDDGLLKAVLEDKQNREAEGDAEDEEDWDEIAKNIPDKTPVQCLKRHMILIKRKSIDNGEGGDNISASSTIAASITTDTDTTTTAKTTSQEERKMTLEEKVKEEGEKEVPVDEEEEDDDDNDDEEGKDSKRPRKEGDLSTKWPQDDLDLLKKLVENYKDCKSRSMLQLVCVCERERERERERL